MTSTTKANPDGLEIRLEGLHRRFGSVRALDDLSITLAPGELVALLGPSGCGKTTALRVVAGLDEPDEGRVVVGDRDVTKVPANKRDMGMVFQAYSLFPHLTSAQNVEFGLKLRGVDRVKRSARAKEMLELVGLSAHADRYASQLSGGQQQRVALARALAIEPGVLLLDEPLSALDAKVRAQLREEIRRVQLEVGTTTLFVTHALRRTGDPVRGRVRGLDEPHPDRRCFRSRRHLGLYRRRSRRVDRQRRGHRARTSRAAHSGGVATGLGSRDHGVVPGFDLPRARADGRWAGAPRPGDRRGRRGPGRRAARIGWSRRQGRPRRRRPVGIWDAPRARNHW